VERAGRGASRRAVSRATARYVNRDAPFRPREILRALATHEVEYLVVGGIAVQAHGGQRLTRDLDVAVPVDRANFDRLAAAIAELDARLLGPSGERSSDPPDAALLASSDLCQLLSAHGQIDVVTLPAALGRFSDLRERAHEVELDDLVVPIAALDDLIAMKRAAGRPQDLEDLALLERLRDE
jgi:hypothetical protein